MSDIQCPKCGNRDTGKGIQKGYANIVPEGSVFKGGSEVIHRFCTDCGYILESYVKKPEKFI